MVLVNRNSIDYKNHSKSLPLILELVNSDFLVKSEAQMPITTLLRVKLMEEVKKKVKVEKKSQLIKKIRELVSTNLPIGFPPHPLVLGPSCQISLQLTSLLAEELKFCSLEISIRRFLLIHIISNKKRVKSIT